MNYAIAVFGVMLIIALSFWVIQGRRTYLNTGEVSVAQVILAQEEVVNDPAVPPEPKKQDK